MMNKHGELGAKGCPSARLIKNPVNELTDSSELQRPENQVRRWSGDALSHMQHTDGVRPHQTLSHTSEILWIL